MKAFSTAFIQKLNATEDGGLFLAAIEVTESLSPLVVRRHVHHEEAITYDGQVYEPIDMEWSGFELAQGMPLPTMTVTVANLAGQVTAWLESLNVLERDVRLLILHRNLLGDISAKDQLTLQIQYVRGRGPLVIFTLGFNVGLQDLVPREVITKDEFPGIPDDRVRIQI